MSRSKARLEIAEGLRDVSSFAYEASDYYREFTPTVVEISNLLETNMTEEKKVAHTGKRKSTDIVLETYSPLEEKVLVKDDPPPSPANVSETAGRELGESGGQCRKKLSPLPFFSGNPMVECTRGILHMYKHHRTLVTEGASKRHDHLQTLQAVINSAISTKKADTLKAATEAGLVPLDEGTPRSEMICMISVPAKLTCLDLQQFIGPAKQDIQHLQIVRDKSPNQYMVLVKFKSQSSADAFYKEFNGKRYNSLENEVAQLVFVAKLETLNSAEGGYLPVSGLTELPTCPVCLERMDESVEGILTILCNHSFHTDCLVQWSDLRCPVCRYLQTPEIEEDHVCSECDSKESLWICLICGHIGCGRYQGQHAYKHFQLTSHTFSMQLGNRRVWDYAGDNYVHRLVQTKGDGKLVSFDRNTEFTDDEKLDSLTLEYTYLLTSQLESQRLYFEEKMAFVEDEAMSRVCLLEEKLKKTDGAFERLDQRFQECDKERKNYEKKYTQVLGRVTKLVHELKEEKQINQCLLKNQDLWREQVNEMKEKNEKLEKQRNEEVFELQEQVQDLVRHLETKAAVASASEATQKELEEGHLFMEPTQSPSKSPRQRGRNKKR